MANYNRGVNITFNTKVNGLGAVNNFTKSLQRANSWVQKLNKTGFTKITSGMRNLTNNTTQMGKSLQNSTNKSVNGLRNMKMSLSDVASSIYVFKNVASAIGEVTQALDNISLTQSRMRLMNDGLMTTEQLTEQIYQASQRSRGSFSSTADMVAKLGLLAGDAFKNNQEIVDFAEQLNKQMKIAGTDTIQAKSAMLQLTQALGSGRLQGDELRSIMETMPTIIQSIADELDVPKGKVKELASEGKITAEVLKNAVLNSADSINKKFETVPMTFGQAMTTVMNKIQFELTKYSHVFGNILNSSLTGGLFNVLGELGSLLNGLFVGFAGAMVGFGNAIAIIFSPLANFFNWLGEQLGITNGKFTDLGETMKTVGTILGIMIALWLVYKAVVIVASFVQAIFSAIATGGISLVIMGIMLLIAAILIVPFVIGLMVGDWQLGIAYMVATIVALGQVVVQVFFLIWDTSANIVLGIVYIILMAGAFIIGNIADGLANIVDMCMGVGQAIHNIFGGLGLIIQGIWEKIVGAVQNAFGGMLEHVGGKFESFINMCIRGVNKVIDALNKIPKVNIGKIGEVSFSGASNWGNDNLKTGDGLISKGQAMMNKKVDWQQFSKGHDASQSMMKDINDTFDDMWQTNMDWSKVGDSFDSTVQDVLGWFEKGDEKGDEKKKGDKYKNPFDDEKFNQGFGGTGGYAPSGLGSGGKGGLGHTKLPSGGKNPINSIAQDTGAIKNSVATTEEDLKYLLDVAKKDAINRYGMTEVNINMTNNNNVAKDVDLDGMVDHLNKKLEETLLTQAEEVHY